MINRTSKSSRIRSSEDTFSNAYRKGKDIVPNSIAVCDGLFVIQEFRSSCPRSRNFKDRIYLELKPLIRSRTKSN